MYYTYFLNIYTLNGELENGMKNGENKKKGDEWDFR